MPDFIAFMKMMALRFQDIKKARKIDMAKFMVRQEADYVNGHLRYGHREGVIEADSKEDALDKLQNEGYTDYLDLKVDDYEVEDVDYGDNEFEIEEVED